MAACEEYLKTKTRSSCTISLPKWSQTRFIRFNVDLSPQSFNQSYGIQSIIFIKNKTLNYNPSISSPSCRCPFVFAGFQLILRQGNIVRSFHVQVLLVLCASSFLATSTASLNSLPLTFGLWWRRNR